MKRVQTVLFVFFLGSSCMMGCGNKAKESVVVNDTTDTPNYQEMIEDIELNLGKKEVYLITVSTPKGDMKLVLHNETPLHRDNFVKLIRAGFYQDLLFHRIIAGFMIQGGDPQSKGAAPNIPLGNGGPGYTIPAEFDSTLFHRKGALAAARMGDHVNPQKESSGSQFYIVQGTVFESKEALLQTQINWQVVNQYLQQLFQKPEYKELADEIRLLSTDPDQSRIMNKVFETIPTLEKEYGVSLMPSLSEEAAAVYTSVGGAPNLDGGYTVFGQLVDGYEVLDALAEVPTQPGDRPAEDLPFTITVEEIKIKKLEKEYDYTLGE